MRHDFYSGVDANGSLILKPWFRRSLQRTLGRSRATDSAPPVPDDIPDGDDGDAVHQKFCDEMNRRRAHWGLSATYGDGGAGGGDGAGGDGGADRVRARDQGRQREGDIARFARWADITCYGRVRR